ESVIDQRARIADRNIDPFRAGALAVFDRTVDPAAMRLAEIVGNVCDIEALLRKEMRQRKKTPEQVRSGACIGGNRRLRLHVLIRLARNLDRNAGGLREGLDELHESVVF